MKQDKPGISTPTRLGPNRLIKHPLPFLDEELPAANGMKVRDDEADIAHQPTRRLFRFSPPETQHRSHTGVLLTPSDYIQIDEQLDDIDFSTMNTVQLMQLSGLMRAISTPLPAITNDQFHSDGSSFNSYGQEFVKQATAQIAAVTHTSTRAQPGWKAALNSPIAKGAIGIAVGIVILLLMSRLIDFEATAKVIASNLTTLPGILHTCLAGLAFVAAFSFRGVRWKILLNPIKKVPLTQILRIYWIGVFINFLLPVQGGELAKSIMLKRVVGVPISQSLPIVAIDKALDLVPVLVIIAIVPFIPGIHMNITLWLILALVGSILLGLIVVVALTSWNRKAATALIGFFLGLLPKGIGGKIEGFAMGFVDSLLVGASRPQSFLPAVLMTALAIFCEGLFAWEGFHAVQLDMGLGMAIFGYTVYTMFSILPTPPAGIGSNEGAKTLVFVTLLGFNAIKVNAMAILVHPVCTILMAIIGVVSLRTLGLTLSSILQRQDNHQPATSRGKPGRAGL